MQREFRLWHKINRKSGITIQNLVQFNKIQKVILERARKLILTGQRFEDWTQILLKVLLSSQSKEVTRYPNQSVRSFYKRYLCGTDWKHLST